MSNYIFSGIFLYLIIGLGLFVIQRRITYNKSGKPKKPIEYESEDGQFVDLFFLLLAPEGSGADHLQALSEISKMARNRETRKALREANNVEEIIKIFKSADL